jgi:SAM-dependent methyltransferase
MAEFGELADAYEGLEGSFGDDAELESYRASMLERSAVQADFLASRLPSGAHVLEVGCGNGRLLIELARRGAIAKGFGIDLAVSRIAFAQEWARDEGMGHLSFEAADVFERGLSPEGYSAALCITGAFAYFEPIVAGSGLRFARLLHDALVPRGMLVLELYPHPRERALLDATGGEAATWKELDPEDPWRFYLSRYELRGDVLTHEKTFIHRTSGEVDQGRREKLYLYSRDDLEALLVEAAFREIRFFEGWTDEQYAGGDVLVVTALK